MNMVLGKVIRYALFRINEEKHWIEVLSIVELCINSLPKRNKRYSSFFIDYEYHPTVPDGLIEGTQQIHLESVS